MQRYSESHSINRRMYLCTCRLHRKYAVCEQWCSGGGATGAIAPVPIFQGGALLQFLYHSFLVNFAYILQKLSFYLDYYW